MTEGKGKTLSRVSTSGKLSRLTHDVEGLNKSYKDENERIKRILQMLQGHSPKIVEESHNNRKSCSATNLYKTGVWKVHRTCRLRRFLMK
jgi:hypothetical protein